MKNKKLESAIIYADKFNYAVFPLNWMTPKGCSCNKKNCSHPAKHPLTLHGVKNASKDLTLIREWWSKWPDANIGIACGKISGITVLDVDIKKETDGRETLRKLIEHYGDIPKTPIQISGSGGYHYFFQYEPSIKNKVDFLPGLDMRNDNGYIIGAPSYHESGQNYKWDSLNHLKDLTPSELPAWLLRHAIAENKKIDQDYCRNTKNKWKSIVEGGGEGGRNNAAASLAGHLFYKKVDLSIIIWVMENWNKQNTPPLSANELEKVILSVGKMSGVKV